MPVEMLLDTFTDIAERSAIIAASGEHAHDEADRLAWEARLADPQNLFASSPHGSPASGRPATKKEIIMITNIMDATLAKISPAVAALALLTDEEAQKALAIAAHLRRPATASVTSTQSETSPPDGVEAAQAPKLTAHVTVPVEQTSVTVRPIEAASRNAQVRLDAREIAKRLIPGETFTLKQLAARPPFIGISKRRLGGAVNYLTAGYWLDVTHRRRNARVGRPPYVWAASYRIGDAVAAIPT